MMCLINSGLSSTKGGSKQGKNEQKENKSDKTYLRFPDKYNVEFPWWKRENDNNINRLNSFYQASKWGIVVHTAFVSIRLWQDYLKI